jgi:hypothetical protein
MPCSCCKEALTFQEAKLIKEKPLTGGCAMPNEKDRDFKAVPATACWGIQDCKERFGLGTGKSGISAHLKPAPAKTKPAFFSAAAELYGEGGTRAAALGVRRVGRTHALGRQASRDGEVGS